MHDIYNLHKLTIPPLVCALHNSPSPCLSCIFPEVAAKIASEKNKEGEDGILFQDVDTNVN